MPQCLFIIILYYYINNKEVGSGRKELLLTCRTVSLTMLYYLKLLTLLNRDLINFGNIKI